MCPVFFKFNAIGVPIMPQPMKPILSSLGGTWLITFSSDVFDSPVVVVVVLAMVVAAP